MPEMGGRGAGGGHGDFGSRPGRGSRTPPRDPDRHPDREVRFVSGGFGCPPGWTWSPTKGRCIKRKKQKQKK